MPPFSGPTNTLASINKMGQSILSKVRGPLRALESPTAAGDVAKLMFPRDEILDIDHWVTFKAFKTEQLDRSQDMQKKELTSIRLPMPASLTTGYNIQYSDENLGPIGSILADAFGNTPTSKENAQSLAVAGTSALAGAAVGGLTGGNVVTGFLGGLAGGVITSGAMGGSTGGAAAAEIANVFGQTSVGGAILANSGGIAVNPHKVVLFQGVGFRNHSFAFQFVPRSYKEAQEITNIIRAFKYHSSPGFFNGEATIRAGNLGIDGLQDYKLQPPTAGKHFFSYPDFFTIAFHNDEHLFRIGPSVVESFSVDYHPLNTPAYAREGGNSPTPVQINIQIQFQETEIVTKDNIEKDGR